MARRALMGSWNDADIRDHHQEMVELLFGALGKEAPKLSVLPGSAPVDVDAKEGR